MRRMTIVITLSFFSLLPSVVAADGIEARLGAFIPRADSGARDANRYDLFQDNAELYTIGRSDWTSFTAGFEYTHQIASKLELGVHIDGQSRTNDTVYRDYTYQDDSEIPQTLRLTVVPLGATLRFLTSDRRGSVQGYAALGADVIFWRYEAWGEFVDFGDPGLEIDYAEFEASGAAPGLHVAVGARIPLSYDLSLTAEGRYQWAEADMGRDFSQNRIDLTGASFTMGVHLRF